MGPLKACGRGGQSFSFGSFARSIRMCYARLSLFLYSPLDVLVDVVCNRDSFRSSKLSTHRTVFLQECSNLLNALFSAPLACIVNLLG